jgi:hypothetical protein
MKRSAPLVRRTPLKPSTKRMKRQHRACGRPTPEQQEHQDAQRAHGCAMCRLLGLDFKDLKPGMSPCGRTQVHHRTTGDLHGQLQLGQDETVALGDYHHEGTPKPGYNNASMRAKFGPSLALHKRAFVDLLEEKLGERSTAALQRWQDERIASVPVPEADYAF